jgi:opacity protein-like surface antigen
MSVSVSHRLKSSTAVGAFAVLCVLSQAAVAQDWAGTYIGANIGLAAPSVENDWNSGVSGCSTGEDCSVNDLNTAGISFGGVAGVNWQKGDYVFGVEADVSSTSIKNDTYYYASDDEITNSERAGLNIDMLASVRGRAGMTFGDNLVYATAGIGFMSGEFVASTSDSDPYSGIKSISAAMPVVGLGFQKHLGDNLSLDVNAQHYIGTGAVTLGNLGDGETTDSQVDVAGITTLNVGLRFDF